MRFELRAFLRTLPIVSIWSLVWPQTATMLCAMIIGLTDIWVAGRIDSGTQAAIGFSTQIQAFLMVLGMSLGAGAMAAVSQSMGAGRRGRVQRYVGLVMVLGIVFGLLLSVSMYLGGRMVLGLLYVPAGLEDITRFFYHMLLLGLPAQYVMNVGSVLFRASRNVLMPLFVVIAACLINVFGDLGFGLGLGGLPAYGASGIAWSTFVAVCTGAVLMLLLLLRTRLMSPRVLPPLAWVRHAAPYLLKVSLPALLTQFLWQGGYLSLFVIMAALPDSVDELAGMTAGIRVESMLFMPAVAFNMTAAIMVGNLLGAGKVTEARRTGLAITVLGVLCMSMAGACMWCFMDALARFFSPNQAVQEQIMSYLFYNILSTPFTVGSMILNGVMTGAGATLYTLVVNTSCIWLVRLPLAWVLAHVVWGGSRGVYTAMLASMMVQASAMLWVFFRKNWPGHAMRRSCSAVSPAGTANRS